jgi:MerR family redox-sensitive transcriptional activator SoxR
MSQLSIGELARAASIATSAIRYYEKIGLLPRAARVGGKRRFGPETLARLHMIQTAQVLGFNLREVRLIMVGADGGRQGLDQLKQLATKKLPEIELTLRRARLMKRYLQAAERCCCPSLEACLTSARRAGVAPSRTRSPSSGP